jgi:hypothetical protein
LTTWAQTVCIASLLAQAMLTLERSKMASKGSLGRGGSLSCPALRAKLPRQPVIAEAVLDPLRHFATANYCIAKGHFADQELWKFRSRLPADYSTLMPANLITLPHLSV